LKVGLRALKKRLWVLFSRSKNGSSIPLLKAEEEEEVILDEKTPQDFALWKAEKPGEPN